MTWLDSREDDGFSWGLSMRKQNETSHKPFIPTTRDQLKGHFKNQLFIYAVFNSDAVATIIYYFDNLSEEELVKLYDENLSALKLLERIFPQSETNEQ